MKKEQVDYKENLIGELCRNEFEIIPLEDWRYCYYDGRTAKQCQFKFGWRLHRRNKVVFLTGLFLTCYFFALFLPPHITYLLYPFKYL